MDSTTTRPTVFVSYSHEDEAWKNRLVKQLRVLELEGDLEVWDDRRISVGDDWLPEIEAAMARCRAAVLLISADFLTSKFILGTEVPEILRRREADGLRVIPVIVHPCAWKAVPWLSKIACRPKDGKPLASFPKSRAEQHLADLALEIRWLFSSPGAQTPGSGSQKELDAPATRPNRRITKRVILFMLLPAAAMILYFLTLWQPNHPSPEPIPPTVRLTDVPCGKRASDDNGMISGQIEGLSNPQQYKIVIYARTNIWFVQPTEADPLTDVMSDGTWTNSTNPGRYFVALLVEPPYTPRPQAEALPSIGGAILAKSKIFTCPQKKE